MSETFDSISLGSSGNSSHKSRLPIYYPLGEIDLVGTRGGVTGQHLPEEAHCREKHCLPWEQLLLQSSVGGLGVWEGVLEEVMSWLMCRIGQSWEEDGSRGREKGLRLGRCPSKLLEWRGLGVGEKLRGSPAGPCRSR